ncbi:hypothetical protein [Streptomyces thioluteus]|uniref:hypothetical protein n=1 Tax=Streptomyces thioluteus TaxID=66431 RepID=UPI0031EE3299
MIHAWEPECCRSAWRTTPGRRAGRDRPHRGLQYTLWNLTDGHPGAGHAVTDLGAGARTAAPHPPLATDAWSRTPLAHDLAAALPSGALAATRGAWEPLPVQYAD